MREAVLEVSHLRVADHQRDVLKDVSFALERGTSTALLGPQGAGKSTLIRTLGGLLFPEEGTVSLLGSRNDRELRRARRRTGFMLESPFGYDNLTVEQNLNIRAALYGRPDQARLRELRQELRLTEEYHIARKEKLKLLSVGETGRYSLAVALVNRPEILILDEPLVGVDPENRTVISALLNRLREEGVTLLISGQSAAELQMICTRALLLEEGILRGPVPMEEALKEEEAEEAKEEEEA